MNKEQLLKSKTIARLNDFNPSSTIDRVYIKLAGYNNSYKGDKNYKIYLDNKTGEITIQRGSGTTSPSFDESLYQFKKEFSL